MPVASVSDWLSWMNVGDGRQPGGMAGARPGANGASAAALDPPVLVRMRREHLTEFGTATDGQIFQTERVESLA